MKILAIGRNYVDHIAELNNEMPDEPVIFLKPDTALLRNNDPFFHPQFSEDIHYECELVVRMSRAGKGIEENFAHKYYDAIGLGIDMTARDLQSRLKAKGLPWEKAKGFDHSAPISPTFIPTSEFEDIQNIDFSLSINGELRQQGNSSLMINPIDKIISHISSYFTLKKGDLIFTGTPKGVGKLNIGDRLEGFIGNKKMLSFEVK